MPGRLRTSCLKLLACAVGLLACNGLFAQPQLTTGTRLPIVRSSVLPADEAFALSTFIEAPDTMVLLWELTEGYYLYRKSIAVLDDSGETVAIGELPAGETISDEFFGESAVYFDRLLVRFPLAALGMKDNAVRFTVQYQGCAEEKYCYPMQVREVELNLP